MAFGFFRRRQKMVIIIMAVLMVSFLIGFQGFNMVFSGRQDPLVGRVSDEKILRSAIISAESDVKVLRAVMDNFPEQMYGSFMTLLRENGERDADLAYALLLTEAGKAKVRVSDSEVEDVIGQIVKNSGCADQQQYYAVMRERSITKQTLSVALNNWLTIYRNYQANQLGVPPSQPELRRLYQDTREMIDLRVAKIGASDFVIKDEPTDSEVQTLFMQFRNNPRDVVSQDNQDNPFGLGYRQPDRAAVQYLLLKRSAVERVSNPTDEQVRKYYLENKATYDARKKQLSDVAGEIAKTLEPSAAQSRIEAVLGQVESLVSASIANVDPAKDNVYEQVKAAMSLPADDALATVLKDVSLDGTLEQVVGELAKRADLDAICYPFNVPGGVTIDPELHVILNAKQITLDEALREVTKQAMGPQAQSRPSTRPAGVPVIMWKMCKGLDRVLFPTGPENLDLFPLQAGDTGLEDVNEMFNNPVVGHASTGEGGRGTPLVRLVFAAQAFSPPAKEKNGAMSVGTAGQPMKTGGLEAEGTLLWRLSQAKPSYVPESQELRTNPKLRESVVKDWKDRKAYALALDKANMLEAAAKKVGLEAAVKEFKDLKLKTDDTGMFARKRIYSPLSEFFAQMVEDQVQYLRQSGKPPMKEDITQIYAQAMRKVNELPMEMREPMQVPWSEVPGVNLESDSPLPRQQLIDAAFLLAPRNIEPPYSDKPPVVGIAEIKLLREVLVMERIGFRPIVLSEFEGKSADTSVLTATKLAAQIVMEQRWTVEKSWFSMDNITGRTGFQKEAGQ